jgi:small subunit ribosomal protein S7e
MAIDGPRSKLVIRHFQSSSSTANTAPSDLDLQVAKALFDMQSSNAELGVELRLLQIYGAKEVDLGGGRKAIVLSVPIPQLKAWRGIQLRVVRELEKKFGDRQVIVIGYRRILPKPKHGASSKQARPRSRTLTSVHEAWLEDMVYPTEIVGKRTRVKTDGHRTIKVLLDPKDQTALESKIDTFAAVYRKLTGKDVAFEFPIVGK